jgi:cytochrome c peroxidase
VVRHYSELDEDRLHADGQAVLRRLDLSADQASDLVIFLRTLGPACDPQSAVARYAGRPARPP